jgi:subtilisin family serine protease
LHRPHTALAAASSRCRAAALAGLLLLVLACAAAFAAPAGATYYYCQTGLLSTGTDDERANGSNCSYWLLPSFPAPAEIVPDANAATPAAGPAIVPGLDVLPVWARTKGAGVTVAVVDTGIDPAQTDYAPNLVPGWNFFDGNGDTTDGFAHGTLLASIIAAASGNGSYVGIAPEATLMPLKIMGGQSGGEWSDAAPAKAIEYAVAHGARVINCSWGGLNTGTIPGLTKALADATKANVLVVISAGNDGVDLDDTRRYAEMPNTQAYGLPNTLSVANFSDLGMLAKDSNYGARHVQVASLGDTLWGDYPGTTNGGYVGGTSAAAATVSGVAALLFSAYPNASAAQVRRAIIVGANRSIPALRGTNEANGLLSASGALAAMDAPDTTPPSPFRFRAVSAHFKLRHHHVIRFRWNRSSDPELEGYKLTVDGKTTIVHGLTVSRALKRGRHTWTVRAYDLSDNETRAHA